MAKKYCIGCVHLFFAPKVMGYGSEWTGSWTRENAKIACSKGHWSTWFSENGPVPIDFEKAMESASTCGDYQERVIP